MADKNDSFLLREYAERHSESAFNELVRRHVNFVYSVAMCYLGNPPDAQDVTQAVFVILAQKSSALCRRTTLTGWLYETTRLTSRQTIRGRARRLAREQEAYMQFTSDPSGGDALWCRLAPHLEEAMSRLRAADRELLALRFYENKTGAEAAALLGIGAAAAHKRTNRALEKLQSFFARRGVSSTTAIIAGAISNNSVQAVPVGLAQTISAIAITKGAAASTSTLTPVKGALKIMAWSKTKTAIVAGVFVLLAAGTTTVTINKIAEHKADESWRVRPFDSRVLDRTSPQVKILPAQSPRGGDYGSNNGKMMGTGVNAETVVRMAYGFWSPVRTILSIELPKGKYDFIASLPSGNAEALQQEVKKQFGVVARLEMVETNVLLLTVEFPNAQGLKPTKTRNFSTQQNGLGHFSSINQSVSFVAGMLEGTLQIPVIDQTGLTQSFDIDLKWNRHDQQHNSSKQALTDQLGLELVPAIRPVEFLVVEKAK